MATYIKGSGGCDECSGCAPDAPCTDTSPAITSPSTSTGSQGIPYSYFITSVPAATSYGVTGTLPTGLSLNTGTGEISGTPSGTGSSSVTISATNSCGTGTLGLGISIVACGTVPVVDDDTIAGQETVAITPFNIIATNTPTTYGAVGLPTGLSVNSGTGQITGTPAEGTSGSHVVTISAGNACGTGYGTLTVNISACESPPLPDLLADQVEVSGNKCGILGNNDEFNYYLRGIYSGTMSYYRFMDMGCSGALQIESIINLSGEFEFEWDNWTQSANGLLVDEGDGCVLATNSGLATWEYHDFMVCDTSGTYDMSISSPIPPAGSCTGYVFGSPPGTPPSSTCPPSTWSLNFVSDSVSNVTSTGCQGHDGCAGFTQRSLVNEYATSNLENDVFNVIDFPSFPNTFTGSALATKTKYGGISGKETGCQKSTFKYKFALPDLSSYSGFSFEWNEYNSNSTFVTKSYLWNGVDTETPVYELDDEPDFGEEITITDITITSWSC
jgi:hypothetical protein